MLILGQIVLADASFKFSLSNISLGLTTQAFSPWFFSLWLVPAHAANWGKYPALISLALIPFIVSLAHVVLQNQGAVTLQNKWKKHTILVLSIVVTALFHSRSLIILMIVSFAWIIAAQLGKLSLRNRSLIFITVFIGLVFEIFFIQKQSIFLPL